MDDYAAGPTCPWHPSKHTGPGGTTASPGSRRPSIPLEEPWVEVPGAHISDQAAPGRPPFHRVSCDLRFTQSAPPFPNEGPVSRDEGLAR